MARLCFLHDLFISLFSAVYLKMKNFIVLPRQTQTFNKNMLKASRMQDTLVSLNRSFHSQGSKILKMSWISRTKSFIQSSASFSDPEQPQHSRKAGPEVV